MLHKAKDRGIAMTMTSSLEDLDYDDDLGQRHQGIQQKTEYLNSTANKIGKSTLNRLRSYV